MEIFLVGSAYEVVRPLDVKNSIAPPILRLIPDGTTAYLPLSEVSHFRTLWWKGEFYIEFWKGKTPYVAFNFGKIDEQTAIKVITEISKLILISKKSFRSKYIKYVYIHNIAKEIKKHRNKDHITNHVKIRLRSNL